MTSRGPRIAFASLFACSLAFFASTAARSIGWWEGSQYPVLAATLSIANPPGSLLLTLLGWLWTRAVWCPPFAFQLNLLAALFAAATVTVVAWVTARLVARADAMTTGEAMAGVAAGAWLATALQLWTHATQFTPYGLQALFTALLLAALVRWWRRAEASDDITGLALVGLLLGLDLSVHRTNQLLAPAIAMGVLLRRPGLVRRPLGLAAGLLAYAAGAATQTAYLALSARHPLIDMLDARSPAGLWSFVRLDPIGGGFLLSVWPRRADFLRVQFADWGRFLWTDLGAVPATRVVALLLALVGVAATWRRSRRLAVIWLALFASAGLGAVLYFNRPESYFRTLDRHYLPSLVVLAAYVGLGVRVVASGLRAPLPAALRSAPAVLVAGLVAWNAAANHASCDRSRARDAERFGRDLLEPLAPRAILFTNGDNDTFPLYYLQQVERVRPDVLVVNLPILWTAARQRSLQRSDPAFATVQFGDHPAGALVEANRWRRPVYVAVTVPPESAPELHHDLAPEGFVSRMLPPGSPAPDASEFERFYEQRALPALTRREGEVGGPDTEFMLGTYVFTAMQLARLQAEREDASHALATLAQLERAASLAGSGEWARQTHADIVTIRKGIEERGIAPAKGGGP